MAGRSSYREKGLWHATYGPYEPSPPLRDAEQADVAVVGAGYTGAATALHLRKLDPSLNVTVLESEVVGYGASGRNGSFAMTVVGLGLDILAKLKGRETAKDAHHYMERAVDSLGELVEKEGLDCDYTRPGFLRMATAPSYVERLQREIELAQSLGIEGIDWLGRDAARERVRSDLYLGAWWEPRTALVNPLKLVREMARRAVELGAVLHEHSPVTSVERTASGFRLATSEGSLTAAKVVFATNAYSHLIPMIARKQVPAWTYIVATEPLGREQLDAIGWAGREGVEDARNLIHYYRITPDDRLLMGGGPVGLSYGDDMERDSNAQAWAHLEQHIGSLFPALGGTRISHRWGGPFSVTLDLTPALGYLGDKRAVYSLGCIGHGVSMTQLNGRVIADLILERDTDLTSAPFVNRRVLPWPPEPLRLGISAALRGYLRAEDWLKERGMPRA